MIGFRNFHDLFVTQNNDSILSFSGIAHARRNPRLIRTEDRLTCSLRHPGCKKTRTEVRVQERFDEDRFAETGQNECRIPIRTSACVCVVDGVKL